MYVYVYINHVQYCCFETHIIGWQTQVNKYMYHILLILCGKKTLKIYSAIFKNIIYYWQDGGSNL